MVLQARNHEQFTTYGKAACLIALMFVFSISAAYRLNLAGLLIHPYLIVLPVLLIFTGFAIRLVPNSTVTMLAIFFFFFCMGSLQNINPLSEITKVFASLLTFLFFVQSVRTAKDFRMIIWGFVLVALVIGVIGFSIGEEAQTGARLAGINALEGIGNKNAQSLFTLPGVFLAIYLAIHYLKTRRFVLVGILLLAIFFITVQIFLSANRSGWIGLFIIFVSYLLFYGVNIRTILISAVLGIFVYLAIDNYAADIFERKRTQTTGGYRSDVGRQMLIVESLSVGLEHPFFGVGFDNLTTEMARRLGVNRFGVYRTDTHFLFGYIFGATGIFSLLAFLLFLIQLCKARIQKKWASPAVKQARILIISFVLLFVIRSFFTREILYSPTFIGGLGLLYGYYLMQCRAVISASNWMPIIKPVKPILHES